MALVTTKDMFEKAIKGGYAVGAFNVNNMEIIQGIAEAAKEEHSPVIMQVSAGARKACISEKARRGGNGGYRDRCGASS